MRHRMAIWLILGTVLAARVLGADPRLTTMLPRGAQRGTEIKVQLVGDRLADAVDIVFYSPGIEVVELNPVDARRVDAVLRIEPDCPEGLYAVRVRTETGISNLRTFSIGSLAETQENEPNNASGQAQPIEPGTIVNGVVTNEDIDYYAIEASEGEFLTAEIEGLRLGDTLFDPFISIIDEAGFEIGSCDDHPLLKQDALVSVQVPKGGRYLVLVRESAYGGSGACRYRLHLTKTRRPVLCMPAGAAPGETIGVRWIGGGDTGELRVPEDTDIAETHLGWASDGVMSVSPPGSPGAVRVRAVGLTGVTENEPNDSHDAASPFTAPAALHGVLESAGDRDCFVFSAAKGQTFDITVFGRRLGSPIDSVVTVNKRGGGGVAGNDDKGGPDSELRFTAPDDGEYVITIRDHLSKGGSEYAYRIEVNPPRAAARVSAPRDEQAIAVPQGNLAVIMLSPERIDLGADLALGALGLPAGVTVEIPVARDGIGAVPAVFRAENEAALAHTLTSIDITNAADGSPIPGGFRQDIEQVLGRNRVVFWAHSVSRLPVAVTKAAPFSVVLEAHPAPVVQNGSASLLVRATRREGWDGPIKLSVPFLPPGVSADQSVVIKPGQTEARIAINAGGRARLGDWRITVAARAASDAGEVRVCSDLIDLRIASPFVAFKPQSASVEQGQKAAMYVEISRLEGFTGKATVKLAALPHNVTAEPLQLTGDDEALTFSVSTAPDSPAGRHKGVFCLATFETEQGEVVHRLPAGELLIQKPRPVTTAAAAPPPPPPPPAGEAPPKPPTRLEKLRMEHEAQRKQGDEQ